MGLEGYAFVDIPRMPGEYDLQAKLWAPVGTVREELHGAFCGSFVPLASVHLVAVADMHRRDQLPRDRSGLRAQTVAGVLHVRVHVLRYRPDSAQVGAPKERSRYPHAVQGAFAERPAGLRRRRRRGQSAEAGVRALDSGTLG
mmetsp:Transcript_66992/g.185541  ORF Transcript_66992/g.185541 Transcript_66992/m.185541 type:complete len:143 (+) Transcript_66992:296-724(+)